jgi:hypothetical protein
LPLVQVAVGDRRTHQYPEHPATLGERARQAQPERGRSCSGPAEGAPTRLGRLRRPAPPRKTSANGALKLHLPAKLRLTLTPRQSRTTPFQGKSRAIEAMTDRRTFLAFATAAIRSATLPLRASARARGRHVRMTKSTPAFVMEWNGSGQPATFTHAWPHSADIRLLTSGTNRPELKPDGLLGKRLLEQLAR